METSPAPNSVVARAAESPSEPKPEPSLTKVSDRPSNPKGSVFIVEYHHILDGKTTMHRSPKQFRADLERFYKMGFRPVTVSDYLDDKMPLGAGASPMVFTFDDSNPSQLRLLPDGKVDPGCAVGIWQDFAKTHPDFPVRATFYVLPDVMWGQREFVAQKVGMLREMGCELGNHTVTHPILRRLPDAKVEQEIGQAALALEKFGEKPPFSLAYPFGSSPKNSALVKGFTYHGKKIVTKAAMLVGANPAPPPAGALANRYRIPRIQACAGDWGIDAWLDKVAKGSVKVYVK